MSQIEDSKADLPPVTFEYTTRDLNLAAYLLVLGHPLVRMERDPRTPRRLVFVFANEAGKAAPDFFAGHAMVQARAYAAAIRDLKAQLYYPR